VGLTPPPPSSAEVLERVELYLYPPKGHSWPIKKCDNLSSKEYVTYLLGSNLIFMYKLDAL